MEKPNKHQNMHKYPKYKKKREREREKRDNGLAKCTLKKARKHCTSH